jgi:hypothetical protein
MSYTLRPVNGMQMLTRNSDGAVIPRDPDNRDYADFLIWTGHGNMPMTEVAQPTATDVRAEASRRMQALLGARDAAHLDMLVTNGTREAVRLLRKGSATWTPEEAARAAQLEQVDIAIEAIRAASNGMEAAPPPDYMADARWP